MSLKANLMKTASRIALKTKKNSPEILVVAGVVGFVGTVILASKATLKVDAILEDHQDKVSRIKDFAETAEPEVYSDKDLQKDLFITYTQTTVQFLKSYLPAATLGVVSIGCFLTAHKVLKSRNLALMMTYKALENRFSNYRKRVVEDYGQKIDNNYFNGIRTEEVTIPAYTDEDGKKHKASTELVEFMDEGNSKYAVVFCDEGVDEDGNVYGSHMWSRTPGGNELFIKATEDLANHTLKRRGHVFLNEVYEWLGLPHTAAGALTGWVLGNGDDYIDFNTYILNSQEEMWKNGHKKDFQIVLDFNVDGVVYDLLADK